ncbi:hypothetical protein ACFZ8E_05705 [Methylobacterium sp. HMF5984]|uniref:hypothetical protein n=1 Tax=Methylobacterium sp. HMF5984 TaxID=3367370 RepID=UPI0038523050
MTLTVEATRVAGMLPSEQADLITARHLAPLLDRITAAEARAEEAEKRGSRDFWQSEARGMKAEADLIDLARMYGEACRDLMGEAYGHRLFALHYGDACEALLAATADRDRLADEVARLSAELASARSTGTDRSEAEANWQPISTAPSDGRPIIIARRGAKEPEVVPADGEWWRSTVCWGLDQRPQLWCELPTIPAQAAGGDPSPPPARGREDADG